MIDEELINALWAAADRIKALSGDLESVLAREASTQERHDLKVDALEAKLAKAMAALQDIFEKPRSADWTYAELISEMNKEAREALAEIEKETK